LIKNAFEKEPAADHQKGRHQVMNKDETKRKVKGRIGTLPPAQRQQMKNQEDQACGGRSL
jgi:hypothetical protein